MIVKINEGQTGQILLLSDNNQSQEVEVIKGAWLRPYEGVIYNPARDYVDNVRVDELSKAIVLYGNVQQEDVEIKAGDTAMISYSAINDATPIPGTEYHYIDKEQVIAFGRNGAYTSVNGWLVGTMANAADLSAQGHVGKETECVINLVCEANYTKGMIMEPHFTPNHFQVGDELLVDGKKVVNLCWLGHELLGHENLIAVQKTYCYGRRIKE
jgi:hypothetical protein